MTVSIDFKMFHPEIDAMHQSFVELINDLNAEIVNQRRDKPEIMRLLKEIMTNCTNHFAHEEKLYNEKSFPGAQSHAKSHARIVEKLRASMDRVDHSDLVKVWVEEALLIEGLVKEHELQEDREYVEFLRLNRH